MNHILSIRWTRLYTWLCITCSACSLALYWRDLWDIRQLEESHPRLNHAYIVAEDIALVWMLLLVVWGVVFLVSRPWLRAGVDEHTASLYRKSTRLDLSLVAVTFMGLFWLWPNMQIIPPATPDQVIRYWILVELDLVVLLFLVLLGAQISRRRQI